MSEAYVAWRVWGDKRTRLKMSVSPVAMTAGKVWQGLKCYSQRPDYLLQLIELVIFLVWLYTDAIKIFWRICTVIIKNKESNSPSCLNWTLPVTIIIQKKLVRDTELSCKTNSLKHISKPGCWWGFKSCLDSNLREVGRWKEVKAI